MSLDWMSQYSSSSDDDGSESSGAVSLPQSLFPPTASAPPLQHRLDERPREPASAPATVDGDFAVVDHGDVSDGRQHGDGSDEAGECEKVPFACTSAGDEVDDQDDDLGAQVRALMLTQLENVDDYADPAEGNAPPHYHTVVADAEGRPKLPSYTSFLQAREREEAAAVPAQQQDTQHWHQRQQWQQEQVQGTGVGREDEDDVAADDAIPQDDAIATEEARQRALASDILLMMAPEPKSRTEGRAWTQDEVEMDRDHLVSVQVSGACVIILGAVFTGLLFGAIGAAAYADELQLTSCVTTDVSETKDQCCDTTCAYNRCTKCGGGDRSCSRMEDAKEEGVCCALRSCCYQKDQEGGCKKTIYEQECRVDCVSCWAVSVTLQHTVREPSVKTYRDTFDDRCHSRGCVGRFFDSFPAFNTTGPCWYHPDEPGEILLNNDEDPSLRVAAWVVGVFTVLVLIVFVMFLVSFLKYRASLPPRIS